MEMTNTTTPLVGDSQESADDTWTVVACVLGVVLLCLLLGTAFYFYYTRYGMPTWLRCCEDPAKREGIQMGYLPADITVNEAAVEQGVPDIFLRNSESSRISMEPSSVEISRDSASGVETSGTWAEYLRATLSIRRTATLRASERGAKPGHGSSSAPTDEGVEAESDFCGKAEREEIPEQNVQGPNNPDNNTFNGTPTC